MDKPHIYLIYDTSFLVLEDDYDDLRKRLKKAYFSVQNKLVNYPGMRFRVLRFLYRCVLGNKRRHHHPSIDDYIDIYMCVPRQVEEELKTYFKNEATAPSAEIARKRIIDLYESGAVRIDLPRYTNNLSTNSVIGADSPVDKGILSWALTKTGEAQTYCIILTDDGGIIYDIVEINKGNAKVSYCTKEKAQVEKVVGFITSIARAFKDDSYEWESARVYMH